MRAYMIACIYVYSIFIYVYSYIIYTIYILYVQYIVQHVMKPCSCTVKREKERGYRLVDQIVRRFDEEQ